jgi:hypothetical protein
MRQPIIREDFLHPHAVTSASSARLRRGSVTLTESSDDIEVAPRLVFGTVRRAV